MSRIFLWSSQMAKDWKPTHTREDRHAAWDFFPQSFWKDRRTPKLLSFQSMNLATSLQILFACFAFLKSSSIKIYRQWSRCFQLFTWINCIKLSCLPESCFPVPWPVLQPLLGSSPIFSHSFSSLISKIEQLVMVCTAPHSEARFLSNSTDILFIYVCNFSNDS